MANSIEIVTDNKLLGISKCCIPMESISETPTKAILRQELGLIGLNDHDCLLL